MESQSAAAQIFLSLGTNLGRRRRNLRNAIRLSSDFMTIHAVSPLCKTKPWGVANQPDFLNLCLRATTSLAPLPLLEALKQVEATLGRQQAIRWGPRLIDLDILFYDDLVLNTDRLTIPHPRLTDRAFVLAPLADIAPTLTHPQSGLSITALLNAVDASDVVRLEKSLFEDDNDEF